ncbi:MAG: 16S rRNA processing protein RimM [Bradymonadaceae bacterium]|nr:16S rRNA processing protein RimM [Lujinxingiaceae bacterium]
MTKDRLIVLGKVGRPHGIHGEVRLFLFNDESESIAKGTTLVMHFKAGDEPVVVESIRYVDKCALARFVDVQGREGVDRFKNLEFSIPYDLLPPPADGEFYHVDLIGLDVFVRDDAKGDPVRFGSIDRFFDTGADEVMVVLTNDGQEVFVPMFDDTIEDIDLAAKRVLLAPLEAWAAADELPDSEQGKSS